MKKSILSLIAMILILMSVTSCKEKTSTINLQIDESYELDHLDGAVYSSDDDEIACVGTSGVITGLNEGTTNVIVENSSECKKYKVVVTENAEEYRAVDENLAKKLYAYMGYGYNVIDSGYLNANECSNAPIFNQEKLKNSNKMRILPSTKNESESIEGDSIDSFIDSYNSTVKVSADASYKKYFSTSIKTEFTSGTNKDSESQYKYFKSISFMQTHKVSISAAPSKYFDYLDDNFKADLLNSTLFVSDLIETYGTHVITNAIYGGRLDFDYTLSKKTDKNTSSDLSSIVASIKTDIKGFQADGSFNRKDNYQTQAASSNVRIEQALSTVGGDSLDLHSMEAMKNNYTTWFNSVTKNPVLVGAASDSSLYPIWELIPENSQYIKRRIEIKNYFTTELDKNYNSIIAESYSNDLNSENAKLIEFGSYPQSGAASNVIKALESGKGTPAGSFYETDDIISYKGNLYLKYKVKKDSIVLSYKKDNYYYFLFEKIKWRYSGDYSSESKVYSADKILDALEYSNTSSNDSGESSWQSSNLRSYLNSDFYNQAFNSNEKNEMSKTHTFMNKNHYYNNGKTCIDDVGIKPLNIMNYDALFKFNDKKGSNVKANEATEFAYARGYTYFNYVSNSDLISSDADTLSLYSYCVKWMYREYKYTTYPLVELSYSDKRIAILADGRSALNALQSQDSYLGIVPAITINN